MLLWALLLLVRVAFVRGRDMLLSPEGAPLISVSPESVLITQVQVGGKDMSSICRLLCMLIAASTIALATSAIISAATASPNSPTGELGTDAVYHAHDGLCKSKHPVHSFETTAPHRTRQGTRARHTVAVSIQPFGQYLDSTLCTQTTCGLQAQLLAHGKLSVHVLIRACRWAASHDR